MFLKSCSVCLIKDVTFGQRREGGGQLSSGDTQAEGGDKAKTQKQEHFVEYFRRSKGEFGWSRVSKKAVSGDEIRAGPEGQDAPMQILEGIVGYCEDSVFTLRKMGSYCNVLSTE